MKITFTAEFESFGKPWPGTLTASRPIDAWNHASCDRMRALKQSGLSLRQAEQPNASRFTRRMKQRNACWARGRV